MSRLAKANTFHNEFISVPRPLPRRAENAHLKVGRGDTVADERLSAFASPWRIKETPLPSGERPRRHDLRVAFWNAGANQILEAVLHDARKSSWRCQ